MKPIFEYIDYRQFLRDFYEERKLKHSWFSYRVFSMKVGIDASYLAKVLIGTRHVSSASIAAIAEYCELKGPQIEYFHNLVSFTKARSDKESRIYFERLLAMKRADAQALTSDQYEFYKSWHFSAIRSMLEFYPFYGRKYRELGEQLNPAISAKDAKEAIALLIRLKLIAIDPSGRYVLSNSAITTGPHWQSLAITAFQESTIQLARESLERHNRLVRDISTITLNINEKDFKVIQERIREFRQSLISYVSESTDPDRVYHVNVQLIPLTKLPPSGERL